MNFYLETPQMTAHLEQRGDFFREATQQQMRGGRDYNLW